MVIFVAFAASELLWSTSSSLSASTGNVLISVPDSGRFIAYGVTVWWGTQITFWQSQCDEKVGGGLIQGISITLVSLLFLFTLLLIIPVFFPM